MVSKKYQVWLPLIFALVMIAGMFFGYQLHDQAGAGGGFFKTERKTTLQEAINLIERKYVDSVNVDSLEAISIAQLIDALDPHSVYYKPIEAEKAAEDLAGNFQGIGVEFNVFNDTVNVVYVIANGPSDKAGLKIGDKILKVDTIKLYNRHLGNDEIKNLIRGPRSSKAELTILRGARQMPITVTRGTIPVPSVDAAYMIDKTTGYIKLNKFTDNSYEEFMQALEQLQAQGMKSLIYDLRGNGGGFMQEAVDMADEFLEDNKLVVYTEGVNSKKREYRCKRPGLFESGPLVILVDQLSASASEVLAGALQDWDRATIIGRRTFGKGLVQEQYDLNDGSAIRLTVARYYTPLGRSIQRSYAKGRKVYMDELWERRNNGELLQADSNHIANGEKFTTGLGKIVYGGGGIMPDYFVPLDTSSYQQVISLLINSGVINNYIYNYYLQNPGLLEQYPTSTAYVNGFNRQEELWNGLAKYVAKDSINLSKITGKEKESLELRLKAMLARYKWRISGLYEVLNADDTMINKAREVINKGGKS
jgi:carboxyl-terminal processing protease